MKEALLTVSFGTAVEQARQADICAVECAVAQALPHLPAYQAYTSPTIRRILARRGMDIPGFVPALEQLAQDGVERVYVLPTHLLPGYEYDDLLEASGQMRSQFQLRMAPPLLGDTWGVRALAQILCDRFPRQEGQAVVLLGHGTEHPGNLVYPALQGVLDWLGREDILIGTVEGWPQAEDVLEQLSRQNCRRVLLAPLMLVAGTHAVEAVSYTHLDVYKRQALPWALMKVFSPRAS